MQNTIPKHFNPKEREEVWYNFWMEKGYFNSTPDSREAFSIVIPPPNVTGVLHMGHMLNNTIQDVLARRARLLGKNVCWVPGTDHASIATEAKVVKKLREEGIKKSDLSREEFLKHAWDWTHKHGGIILEQLKKIGASCDWNRTTFTLDEGHYNAVINSFIDLYNKGLIYRGYRMVNWDVAAQTAISDEEVIYKEVNSKLYHVKYKIEDSDEYLIIATTRPETILGDTAICINPEDKRYQHLKGKKAIVPITNRSVPIIFDKYVDIEFGTGCLKVTPAHDLNDYDLGEKHNLESINILNDNGTLNENAMHYKGKDRFEVRKSIVEELEKKDVLHRVEEYTNKIGYSERTDVVIEPKLSLQWFLKMEDISKPALENVMNDEIKFHPAKFKNSYRNWMENIKDWCISRQLWWGHQIPVFYFGEGENDFVVAGNKEKALELAKAKKAEIKLEDLKQDEDVLDTWFSSWLWPITVFDGFNPEKNEIDYYYPTNDLVTAPEIMFFWVARMIIAGYEFKGKKPFENVYYTGIVRDKQGRKMSKSLGNSPDPINLIEEYGADGVRMGMLFSSPAGNDLMFDVSYCEQGRNFTNKIWNAFRLVNSWKSEEKTQPSYAKEAFEWFNIKLQDTLAKINQAYNQYKISEVLMLGYKLVWDDFCSWYLEAIKPPYGEKIDTKTLSECKLYFKELLKIIHPFTPFITEEIWQYLKDNADSESIMLSNWPSNNNIQNSSLKQFEEMCNIIVKIRNVRKEQNIPNKEKIDLLFKLNANESEVSYSNTVIKLGNINQFEKTDEKPKNSFSFLIGNDEFFIPFSDNIDVDAEKEKIQKELDYHKGFLQSINKKLANDRFVNNAPEQVVTNERKKQADAQVKIQALEEKLADLSV